MKRLAASVFLIFFGFVVAACGSGEAEQSLNSAFAEADGLSTGESSVDNPGSGEGQGDGRVLKPEGHKGMWFETEPEDPWEHYVWKSQRFVGDPIDLPKLKAKRPNDPLAGLPDVCDEKVIERMREVGFEFLESDNDGLYYGCHFEEKDPINGSFQPELFSILFDPGRPLEKYEKTTTYQSTRPDVSLVGLYEKSDDNECGVGKDVDGVGLYSMNGVLNKNKPTVEVCFLSEVFFQVFDNIA
ncbi:hypothetical protein [Corynebacterium sp.]|uniref:hypothetical protein n=1 Tax=Corynebacterium sp. TaxID=1720 RepID=UPI002586D2C6|nr:hypothetical protein [Corynebacterium sp.]